MAKTLIEVEVEVVQPNSTEVAATTGTGGAPIEEVCVASCRLDSRSHRRSRSLSAGQPVGSRSDIAIRSDAQPRRIDRIGHFLCTRGRLKYSRFRWALAVVLGDFPNIFTWFVAPVSQRFLFLSRVTFFFAIAAALLCYTELASFFPGRSGAEVVFLEQAYPHPRFFVSTTFAITTVLLS